MQMQMKMVTFCALGGVECLLVGARLSPSLSLSLFFAVSLLHSFYFSIINKCVRVRFDNNRYYLYIEESSRLLYVL